MYKAAIYYETGNFVESEIEAIQALKQLDKTNNSLLMYHCYLRIALSLKEMNNYSKSLEYFDLALNQINKLEKEPKNSVYIYLTSCFNSIGRIYEKEKKLEKK